MSKESKPRSRKENIVVQEVDGEVLVYDLENHKAVCLNHTSAIVWQACDGKRTVAEINDLLGKQLQTKTNEDIVWLALDQLSKEKLIDPPHGLSSKYENVSRRDMMRKIAVGSAIALPIVTGLVAPPAYAQVSVCLGTMCECNWMGPWTTGQACLTFGQGTPCPGTGGPTPCLVCRADAPIPDNTSGPGTCFAL